MSDEVMEITPSALFRLTRWSYGQHVRVKCRIVGFSKPRDFPLNVRLTCPECDGETVVLSDPEQHIALRNFLFLRRKFESRLKRLHEHKGGEVEYSNERAILTRIYVRDITPEKTGDQYIYHDFWAYLVNIPLPSYSRCILDGYLVDDEQGNIIILVYGVKPIQEEFQNFEPTAEDEAQFKKYFNHDSLEDRIDRTIAPQIVGRRDAKIAIALTLHSPLEFKFLGSRFYGLLHTLFLGDSTTGKSEIINWIIDNLKVGEYGTGEAGKRTGLLFTVNPDRESITWGLLPLADLTVALIDGFQRISSEEIGEFREALRQKKIVVKMRVSGEAPCRCRIISAANPQEPIDNFLEHAEAIINTRCFQDPVDITRWDLIVKFWDKDVPAEEIAQASSTPPVIPIDVFKRHVFWAWNLKADDIVFKPEAEKLIKEKFLEFMEFTHSKIPLVHRGYRVTLAKVAASYAILHHDVENKKVVVDKSHVEKAAEFLQELIESWEYAVYVTRLQREVELTDEEIDGIDEKLEGDPNLKTIFEEIINNQGISTTVLISKTGLGRTTVITKAGDLKAMNLIVSKRGRGQSGYFLTAKGVAYVRKKSSPIQKRFKGSKKFKEEEPSEKVQKSSAEKLDEIRQWITENKDTEGLIDAAKLAKKIATLGLDTIKVIEKLKEESFIAESPQIGKWLVVRG